MHVTSAAEPLSSVLAYTNCSFRTRASQPLAGFWAAAGLSWPEPGLVAGDRSRGLGALMRSSQPAPELGHASRHLPPAIMACQYRTFGMVPTAPSGTFPTEYRAPMVPAPGRLCGVTRRPPVCPLPAGNEAQPNLSRRRVRLATIGPVLGISGKESDPNGN